MGYPKDEKGRYIRIPTPLRREAKSCRPIELHKRYISYWKKRIGISDYQLLWISLIKGVMLSLIIASKKYNLLKCTSGRLGKLKTQENERIKGC